MTKRHSNPRLPRRVAGIALMLALLLLLPHMAGCSLTSRDESRSGGGSTQSIGTPSTMPDASKDLAVGSEGEAVSSGEAIAEATRDSESAVMSAERQLLVRTASMRLQVEKIDPALSKLRAATSRYGGIIEALHVSTDEDVPIYRQYAEGEVASDASPLAAYATVRVPQERFDEFLKEIAGLGRVLSQSENSADVTQQHIDLSARLKTLQAEEARLRQFLNAAKDVKDMLAVESELSRVRSEIESLQGQLDYLDRQVALSALTVEFTRPAQIVRPAGTDWGFTDAVTRGIRGAAAILTGVIAITLSILPLLVLAAFALVALFLIRRFRRSREPQSPAYVDGNGHGPRSAESDEVHAPSEDSTADEAGAGLTDGSEWLAGSARGRATA